MIIEQITPNKFQQAYGIACQILHSQAQASLPLQVVACEIAPGKASQAHAHHEVEIFLLTQGQGQMTINQQQRSVSAGDVIVIPRFSTHTLFNSGELPLSFLAINSEQMTTPIIADKVKIFSPPATPNGDLHLGHLAGPYLAADILKRYYTLRQSTAIHVSGTDDHQTYVGYLAEQSNSHVAEVLQSNQQKIDNSLSAAKIDFGQWLRPFDNLAYQDAVSQFFKHLLELAIIQEKEMAIAYCEHCQVYCVEANLNTQCANCKLPQTGHCCENCGFIREVNVNQNHDQCRQCDNNTMTKMCETYVFPINHYKPQLAEYLENLTLPSPIQRLMNQALAMDLEDIIIAYPTTHGIAVPNAQHLRFHVWFEMAAGYLYQQPDPANNIYCFGFDNSFYYLLYNPALLMAAGYQHLLPKYIVSNQFYQLEGEKFSTSRQHAIWVNDFLTKQEPDLVRFYLAHTRPEYAISNFSLHEFEHLTQTALLTPLNSLLDGLKKPAQHVKNQATIHQYLQPLLQQAALYYHPQHFSVRKITRLMLDLLELATRYQHTTALATILSVFAIISEPIMPSLAANIWQQCQGQQTMTWNIPYKMGEAA